FVPKASGASIEVDFDGIGRNVRRIKSLDRLFQSCPMPTLKEVLDKLNQDKDYSQFERVYWEPVLDWNSKQPKLRPLYWRFLLRKDGQYIQASIGYKPRGQSEIQIFPDSVQPVGVMPPVRYGRLAYNPDISSLEIQLMPEMPILRDYFSIDRLDLMRHELV